MKVFYSEITIANFLENDMDNRYDFIIPSQVWDKKKKSLLIDSILKNYPIPPVLLRVKINKDTGSTTYDVIDGKQRFIAIREFFDGKMQLSDGSGTNDLSEMRFSELDEKLKRQFLNYKIPVTFIDTMEDRIIEDIFTRINS